MKVELTLVRGDNDEAENRLTIDGVDITRYVSAESLYIDTRDVRMPKITLTLFPDELVANLEGPGEDLLETLIRLRSTAVTTDGDT